MARRSISLEEKIEKAQASVTSAKAKYDVAVEELENFSQRKERCRARSSSRRLQTVINPTTR